MAANASFRAMSSLAAVDPNDVEFRLFTDEEVRKLSVTKIIHRISFDLMGNPAPGGLYDPAMGPLQKEPCVTCGKSILHCPGHMGHIELPVVTVNPLFIKKIYTVFRMSCLKCFKIQLDKHHRKLLQLQLDLVDAGYISEALDLNLYIGDAKEQNTKKTFKKYKKLLLEENTVIKTFQNKNSAVIRTRIFNNFFKLINVAKTCAFCRAKLIKITTNENKLMYNRAATGEGKGIKILLPDEIKEFCSKIAENDEDLLLHCFPILKHTNVKPVTNAFFMEVLPVPPPVVRPCNYLNGMLIEHPQCYTYKLILTTSFAIRVILKVLTSPEPHKTIDSLDAVPRQAYQSSYGKSSAEKLHNTWQDLQRQVNEILDSQSSISQSSSNDITTSLGVKQIVERKTGIIRMHMMGKRVNFAARSVITPDPNVDIDEIGVPDVFAKKLTYPVPVTEFNVELLRKMVINGPRNHPGAELIEVENGRVIRIPEDSESKRESIAKRLLTPDEFKSSGLKIVHRHLINGDILILNRQPSLHKPSMMAHRARILKGEKTLRLHYANCKSYNADFDGDEMNAHFPQNEIARSEGYNIMSVCKQFLVPKDGTPLSGLIQDHVISGVKMSIRGSFFNKSDYQQLVFQALANHRGKIKLLPPTILKPVVLWSGKQVLSTIIINNIPKDKPYIMLESTAKISSKAWQKNTPKVWTAGGTPFENDNTMTEAEVIIRKGELLCGVLDKSHYGATPYGLVHGMYELYGGASSCALLSSFSKVFTYFLQWYGFTLGVKDILVVDDAEKERDELICLVRQSGKAAAGKATELALDVDDNRIKYAIEDKLIKDPKFRAHLDRQYKSILDTYTNKINTACLSQGLLEKFPYNNLQLMVQSGAKGSTVNTMQISCLLGQIELEGKRPPLMISGKSLPSFPAYDITPRSGGFIDGRFMTGIQPQEFFFHCMAGREGLIDTAVKTSRSGYLQRCLIKHLEGLSVGYDHTVRDSDSSLIQFAYGEDGLDVLKCQYLNSKQLKFLDLNSDAVISKSSIKKLKNDADTSIAKSKKSLTKWVKRNGNPLNKKRISGFTLFSSRAKDDINLESISDNSRDPYYFELERKWREMSEEEKDEYKSKVCPEPIQSKTAPNMKFGAINEHLDSLIKNYVKNRKNTLNDVFTEKEKFLDVMNAKYLASMADPGEPVGLLAAQSIGEPSTQMTLNTFHFAGRGDMNVTLGIPRLREILMTASSNLKTPNMDLPFRSDIDKVTKKAENLRRRLNRVTVADVLEKIDIECKLVVKPERQLQTVMKFSFLPHDQYKTQYCVKPQKIITHMQRKFFSEMFAIIRKQVKATGGIVWTAEKEIKRRGADENKDNEEDQDLEPTEKKTAKADDSDSSDDDEAANEADADNTDAKIRSKRQEEQEYEDPEPEEEENDEDNDQNMENLDENEVISTPQENISAKDNQLMAEVVEKHKSASNYIFDTINHSWCELTVNFPISFLKIDMTQALREAASKSVIYEVKNIKRAITVSDNGTLALKTEGINIIQMFKHDDLLDINRLYSNDVHAMANTYGIEAATKVIVKEIQNVFAVYGITVDTRHLSLISDYMTFNGVFEPMSRKGMESSTSPLQQMSFESSIVFLKEAVMNAKTDSIMSASSRLMLGQPCRMGTGAFDLQHCSNVVV